VEAKANGWPDKDAKVLLEQLKDTSLFEDEAQSLVDVWKQEFFQAEGLTLFYRMPQEQYEKMLPLTMKPKTEKLIRVGLVHRPYFDQGPVSRFSRRVGGLRRFHAERSKTPLQLLRPRLPKLGPTTMHD
jgi:hypothetical protein